MRLSLQAGEMQWLITVLRDKTVADTRYRKSIIRKLQKARGLETDTEPYERDRQGRRTDIEGRKSRVRKITIDYGLSLPDASESGGVAGAVGLDQEPEAQPPDSGG